MKKTVIGVSNSVILEFKKRLDSVLELIVNYNIVYDEIGIFGSYARGDYKGLSDIDFCIITPDRPSRQISRALREDAEILKADIIYVTREYFNNDISRFAKNLRRDYRRLL